ncbi:DUF2939 domain-containing protein [Geomesophilobacter sediminis]|uniref:DUF2939 domain-containing protein n=1 Tax=Geomesophilobacter sediminis TaxID=2798584 RepID=A0A8J7JE43_9BACT|nr:DUF2939 domain-containing protein [Geomesophilobacter sediminis]MBJ6724164.1 DUF2939 domain-containing protein [Geomesophilobacter sediminis]
MSRKTCVIAGSLIVVALAWFVASPYIAVHQMKKAVEAKDAVAISDRVNFPALRESLKGSFSAKFGKEMAKEKDNPFAALGVALAGSMVNSLVDAMVTPESISAIMQGQKPAQIKISSQGQRVKDEEKPDISMGWEKLDRFVVKVKSKDPLQEEISMVFERGGLSWKLTAIRLPI